VFDCDFQGDPKSSVWLWFFSHVTRLFALLILMYLQISTKYYFLSLSIFVSKFEGRKWRHFYGGPRAALNLTAPLHVIKNKFQTKNRGKPKCAGPVATATFATIVNATLLPNRISFDFYDSCVCKVQTRACDTLWRSCAKRSGASRSKLCLGLRVHLIRCRVKFLTSAKILTYYFLSVILLLRVKE